MSKQSWDVLVVGGGVIGLTTAFYLGREGARACLVEQGHFGRESSWAGAGILSATPSPGKAQTGMEQLAAKSAELWPLLSQELQQRTGLDNEHHNCQGIELCREAEVAPLLDHWRAKEIPFTEIHDDRWIALGGWRAFLNPTVSQVRNPRHLRALITACRGLGVEMISGCPVVGLQTEGRKVSGVRTGTEVLSARQVLLAAGAWSSGLLQSVGVPLDVRPVRGQIVLLSTDVPKLTKIIQLGKRYLVPRRDGRVLIGSTEEDAGFQKESPADAIRELIRFGSDLVPTLGQAKVEQCWAGLRPGTERERPYLGAVPGWENLYLATGHYRAGIQLSPGTGIVIKELLLGQPLSFSLEDFQL